MVSENTGKVEEWTDRVKWLPSLKSEHEKKQQVLRTTELLSGFKNSTLRVLCVGYAHSGKSSFIDAIFSLLNGKISTRVNKGFTFDDNASASSVPITDKFEMYKIKYKNEDGEFLTTNVSFGDLPGFQKEGGMTFGHVKKVINGNVPNKYKIKEGITRKNSKRYIDKPKQEDKIHCVCYVFDVCTVDELEETFVTKFKSFQTFLRRKENTGKVEEWTDRVKWLPSLKSEHEKKQQVLRTTELLSGFKNSTLRVLCVGYAHSGKSSFIDAIFSLLNGKISTRVNKGFTFDDNASASSVPITDKFEMYKIKYKNEDGEFLTTNVSFGDLPGFQKEGGMTFGHVKKVINGNVPNKYKIKEGITRKNSKRYIDKPKQEDKIHCVCYVFDVCTVDELEETFVTKFKSFQTFLRRKGIPYVVILTKADKLSVAVKENCLQVFENKAVKEVKDKLLKMFSFLESKIFPVINYVHQNRVNPDMDALLLNVFREILDLGRGYLDDLSNEEEDISDGDEVNDDSE